MPIKDGYQTTKEILKINKQTKTTLEWLNTTVCACTAYSGSTEKQAAHEAGMKFFLSKPVMKAPLEEILI